MSELIHNWVRLTKKSWEQVLEALEISGNHDLADGIRRKLAGNGRVFQKVIRDTALLHPALEEGSVELDDVVQVSEGTDPGHYVSAWLWIPSSQSGLWPEGHPVLHSDQPAKVVRISGTVRCPMMRIRYEDGTEVDADLQSLADNTPTEPEKLTVKCRGLSGSVWSRNVLSYAEASRAIRTLIEEHQLGAREVGSYPGEVFKDGIQVARISFGGRVRDMEGNEINA